GRAGAERAHGRGREPARHRRRAERARRLALRGAPARARAACQRRRRHAALVIEQPRMTMVPVIDVAPLLAGAEAERRGVARAIGRACEDIGFFTIVGHGVEATLVRRMSDVSRAFFDLPLADKQRARRPRPEQSRGYIGVGEENLSYGVGGVTILKAGDVPGGLEVLSRAGEWVAVAPVADAFVVNLGDLMMHWSNDRWISTLHRVANPPRDAALGSRRQSIVFFYQPNY